LYNKLKNVVAIIGNYYVFIDKFSLY